MESAPSSRRSDRQSQFRQEGEAMVSAWRASGLSMRAYAQQSGVSERRLGLWRRRLLARSSATESSVTPSSLFVPVTAAAASAPGCGLAVVFADQIRIEVTRDTDLSLLRATVAALRC